MRVLLTLMVIGCCAWRMSRPRGLRGLVERVLGRRKIGGEDEEWDCDEEKMGLKGACEIQVEDCGRV